MSIMERIVGLVAPHDCLACGAEGSLLCSNCQESHIKASPSRCYRCYATTDSFKVCRACQRSTPLGRVWVQTSYDDLAKSLVQSLKFRRAKAASSDIAGMLARLLPSQVSYLIVPVPTTNLRRRQRGYDQAVEIAGQLAKLTGCHSSNILIRTGTARQVGAKRSTRLQQLTGVFSVKAYPGLSKQPILLVDDVLTTGATLEEAARTLKASGYRQVDAIVFAQA